MTDAAEHPGRRRWVLLLALIAAAVVVSTVGGGAVARPALRFIEWVRGAGAFGVVSFFVVYAGAALLFLPCSLLTLGAGFVYGPAWGTLVASPASVGAAVLAAAVARTVGRRAVERRLDDPRFRALDGAIEREGARIVFLVRLSPLLPFSLVNYLLGLTRIGLGRNALASALGMLPGTLAYAYLGASITSVGELVAGRGAATDGTRALFWAGLVGSLVLAVILSRLARRALANALAGAPAAPPRAPGVAVPR